MGKNSVKQVVVMLRYRKKANDNGCSLYLDNISPLTSVGQYRLNNDLHFR